MGARNGWAEQKKESMKLSQVDGSQAGSIRSDGPDVINHCCRFSERSSSRHGFVTAAVGHSTPMTFCPIIGCSFLLPR